MGDILDPDFNEVAFGDDSKHTWHATPVLDPGLSHYHFGPFPEIEAPLLQGGWLRFCRCHLWSEAGGACCSTKVVV